MEREPDHIGGLRDTAVSLAKLPAGRHAGIELGKKVSELLRREPETKRAILRAIKDKMEDSSHLAPHVEKIVAVLAKAVGCQDTRTGVEASLDCEVRPNLMAAWRSHVQDPDDVVEQWFISGSPLGITRMPERRGRFPVYPVQDPEVDVTELADGEKEVRTFAEHDTEAVKEVEAMVEPRWI